VNFEKVIAVRTNKTVYRDGEKAIKVFDEGFSKADVLNEALNQARIEQTDLNIPNILGITTLEGKWAIISKYIKGKTLAQLIEKDPDKKAYYLDLFVDLQIEIAKQKAPLLNKLKDKMNRKISLTTLDATTRYDLHTRLESMATESKVCHGDFNPSNVIIGDDGKTYILDWAHVTLGNTQADVARTYLLFVLSGDKQTAEEYLNLYCKKSDTAKQVIQKWLPIVAASQLVKGNAQERELLLSWVNVVEYQ
jgi:thiamine kinase-like enzyme